MKKLIILLLLTLTACTTTQEIRDSQDINENEGILVVGLDTNWEGHKNPLLASLDLIYNGIEDSSFNYRSLTFKGNNYILVTGLPAKDYYFYKINFGTRYANLDKGANFTIKPDQITYIGEISIDLKMGLFSAGFNVSINDKWDDTLSYLHNNYPLMLSGRDIKKSIIKMDIAH